MEKSTTAERKHFSKLMKEKSFLGSAKKDPKSEFSNGFFQDQKGEILKKSHSLLCYFTYTSF
jgi:hypothetical protein